VKGINLSARYLNSVLQITMDKEIEALGNLLVSLPNEKFYVLSIVVVVALITMAFIFRNYKNK